MGDVTLVYSSSVVFVECVYLLNCTRARVCVCVYVFSSHSFWTSSSLDIPAGVTQEEGQTGFFIHLPSAVRGFIFLARRIQVLHSLGIYFFIF